MDRYGVVAAYPVRQIDADAREREAVWIGRSVTVSQPPPPFSKSMETRAPRACTCPASTGDELAETVSGLRYSYHSYYCHYYLSYSLLLTPD